MPKLDGVEATRQLRILHSGVQVVVLTMHADEDVIRRAAGAGAAGYLVKDCTTDEVVDAVQRAAAGETTLVAPADTHATGPAGITKREAEVLQLIARGAGTNQVAAKLFISAKTVKNHLASAYQKLDARDRTQAILAAVRLGIVTID
jgi:two-component system, NarL family, response regulator DegU